MRVISDTYYDQCAQQQEHNNMTYQKGGSSKYHAQTFLQVKTKLSLINIGERHVYTS